MKAGKKANIRGDYLHAHRHEKTHKARLRSSPVVPVLLGSTLPRPDRSDAEYARWCRCMLILFKPWRTMPDLKGVHASWESAFDDTVFSPSAKAIMHNLNVENECKDARDEHDKLRRAGKAQSLLGGAEFDLPVQDIESLQNALMNDELL
ncbi:hypothetical protein DFH09DRAFT_940463, partial [Mycena vulgaris]